MSAFIGFAIGTLFGGFLGAVGMYLFIKETALDLEIEREAQNEYNSSFQTHKRNLEVSERIKAPELDLEELEMPRRK